MSPHRDDPIVAIATPAGRGGIGVVRLSFGCWSGGPEVAAFVARLCDRPDAFRLVPRHATLVGIVAADGALIDRGIALLFVAPGSYTGEDVVELQVHGGPVVLQMIVARCLAVADKVADAVADKVADTAVNAAADAAVDTAVVAAADEPDAVAAVARPFLARMRLAEAGEFTERAFLNDKLDLAQAEAVADLIEASSEAAVLGAQASLSGIFSAAVHDLVDRLIELRALVEATLDFPEEEIDFLEASDARGRLAAIRAALTALDGRARRGALVREGLTVVLIGRPNVGKSSLFNALAEADVAIVTPIAGTTRDRIAEVIRLEGIALNLVDTAGVRTLAASDGRRGSEADDPHAVERIGIARTWDAIERAHVVLHVVDASDAAATAGPPPAVAHGGEPGPARDVAVEDDDAIARRLPARAVRRTIVNKIDLVGDMPRVDGERIHLSAATGAGIDLLRGELLAIAGRQPTGETGFLARERHVAALRAAAVHLELADAHARQGDRQLELFAEELRLAQHELDRITGRFSADDLLGEIFGRFCIGK